MGFIYTIMEKLSIETRKKSKFFLQIEKLPISLILFGLFLIKIPFFILKSPIYDITGFFWEGQFLLNGDNPYSDIISSYYTDNGGGIHIHPPNYYYFYSILVLLSGKNLLIFNYMVRFVWNLFDTMAIYGLYLIGKRFLLEIESKLIALIYAFNPTSMFFIGYFGLDEAFTQFLTIFGIYFLLKKKYGRSALFIGLGIAHMIMPVFLLLPILPYFYTNKKMKHFFLLILEILIIYFVLSIPFIMFSSNDFLPGQINMLQREQAGSFLYSGWLYYLNYPLFKIIINISLKFIIQILLSMIIFITFIKKSKTPDQLTNNIFLTLVILPIITLTSHVRLYYWVLPWILLYVFKQRKNYLNFQILERNLKIVIIFHVVFNMVVTIIHLIYWNSLDNENNVILYEWYGYFNYLILFSYIIWMIINNIWNFDAVISRSLSIIYLFYSLSLNFVLWVELNDLPDWGKYISTLFILLALSGVYYLTKSEGRSP
jgi:hypothetical protein